jgi:hypothetical protein
MARAASPPKLPPGRRWAVRGLLVLATLVAVAAVFAVWANRQVLDADNWADTSSQLLQDDAIQEQVAAFLVDTAYSNVDVSGELAAALPPRLEPISGPAASALRQLAENRTERLLDRPRVQAAWETANRVTAQQFIDIVEGDSRAIGIEGNAVILNLNTVVKDVLASLGASPRLADRLPPDAGRIEIMRADQVETLQDGVSALKGLSAVLPGIAIALLALAVWLARGRRRRTLMLAGFSFIAAGLLVLIGRRVAGNAVVDALTSTEAVRPAAEAAWSIGTSILQDVAQAAVIMGIPVVAAAWLAGPARPAVALRRSMAPWLRDRPDVAYGVLAAAVLLVVAWGPIQATRMVLPVLLMVVLATAGLAVLRRQVAAEFPDTQVSDVSASMKQGVARAAHAVTPARGGNGAPAAAPPQGAAPSHVDELERLAALHDRGVLTDDEFAAEKAAVMHGEAVR